MGVVYAAVPTSVHSCCQNNQKVLHSSHFLALHEILTKSVTPCAPTFQVVKENSASSKPTPNLLPQISARCVLRHQMPTAQ